MTGYGGRCTGYLSSFFIGVCFLLLYPLIATSLDSDFVSSIEFSAPEPRKWFLIYKSVDYSDVRGSLLVLSHGSLGEDVLS